MNRSTFLSSKDYSPSSVDFVFLFFLLNCISLFQFGILYLISLIYYFIFQNYSLFCLDVVYFSNYLSTSCLCFRILLTKLEQQYLIECIAPAIFSSDLQLANIFFLSCSFQGRIILSYFLEKNQFLLLYSQRMKKHTILSPILYDNFQLLKGSYKLQSPQLTPWIALGTDLKIPQNNYLESGINQETMSLQLSCNAFSKTKHLFKKRDDSSLVIDDFSNDDIFKIQKNQTAPNIDKKLLNNFQFDSFGRKEHIQNDSFQLNYNNQQSCREQDLKIWNSQSIEINFNKINQNDIKELDHLTLNVDKNNYQIQNFSNDSIKQFCFKLNQNKENNLQATPIKKWSDYKKKNNDYKTQSQFKNIYHEKRQNCQRKNDQNQQPNLQLDHQSNKNHLLYILQEFIRNLQSVGSQEISDSFITETKKLFQRMKPAQRTIIKNVNFTENNQNQYTLQDLHSTVRNQKQQRSKSNDITKRKNNIEQIVSQKKAFVKFQQQKDGKQNKNPLKWSKKQKNKQNRFKF